MKVNTPARLSAYDRRGAAIHEAGHFVIAVHYKLPDVSAWILPNEAGASGGEKGWLGSMQVRQSDPAKLSRNRRTMIAVAGCVAETLWHMRHEADPYPEWADIFYEIEAMSPADWRMADCEPGEPHKHIIRSAEAVTELLHPHTGKLWPALLSTTRDLMREKQIRTEWGSTVPAHVPVRRRRL